MRFTIATFKRQIIYMNKYGISLQLMRQIFKISNPKNQIPSIKNIRKFLTSLKRKSARVDKKLTRFKKGPSNKIENSIIDFIFSKKLFKKIY